MDEKEIDDLVEDKGWMIRSCQLYKEEYSDCTSIKSRFHQRFVHGSLIDCSQWKRDYINCCQWTDEKNKRAAAELIRSEEAKKKERMDAHFANDVWEKRPQRPPGWDDPLPQWMEDRIKNSYLAIKAQEVNDSNGKVKERTFCVIS